ncbi:UDP-N-acetylglucosamine diphosphorylase/glucosamine-1-phosphate N-acetyltransferase [bacterium]|nr:MAG: UDP-N-acetylglucosamine diphosphorylase/glucosamine-1-phosphate N-acetyltransferase [bacterium]
MPELSNSSLLTVVLAAGKGTRMNSSRPKVLHQLRGRPMAYYTLDLALSISSDRILMVLGHEADVVRAKVEGAYPGVEYVVQEPQLGTGHALLQCLSQLEGFHGNVLLLSGDVPALTTETLENLLETQTSGETETTVLTAVLPDPTGYGRIIRDQAGGVVAIREQKDLNPGEESIGEVNMGVYLFNAAFLVRELPLLSNENAQGEYYLTDLVQASVEAGEKVSTLSLKDPEEALGINTLLELSDMEKRMKEDTLRKLMEGGVRIIDPSTTYVDESVKVEGDALLHPMVFLYGSTRIASGAVIHPGAVITDSVIERNVEVFPHSVIDESHIGEGAVVGPFARLRPGNVIGPGGKIGNFVEVKNSRFGEGSKVSHLTYIGDSQLGRNVNVGAGSVTCNYDGFSKHQTVIEDGVFVGSGTMMVAPVVLGSNSIVGAGSTITEDVPPDSLALGRARQEVKEGWARRFREKITGKGRS